MNQAYSRLSTTHGHITDCKLLVCTSMYWTRLVLVQPAASPCAYHGPYSFLALFDYDSRAHEIKICPSVRPSVASTEPNARISFTF